MTLLNPHSGPPGTSQYLLILVLINTSPLPHSYTYLKTTSTTRRMFRAAHGGSRLQGRRGWSSTASLTGSTKVRETTVDHVQTRVEHQDSYCRKKHSFFWNVTCIKIHLDCLLWHRKSFYTLLYEKWQTSRRNWICIDLTVTLLAVFIMTVICQEQNTRNVSLLLLLWTSQVGGSGGIGVPISITEPEHYDGSSTFLLATWDPRMEF